MTRRIPPPPKATKPEQNLYTNLCHDANLPIPQDLACWTRLKMAQETTTLLRKRRNTIVDAGEL